MSDSGEKKALQKTDMFFLTKDETSDIILRVEETDLYASKQLLCLSSPVFEAMLQKGFKEGESGVLELKGKSYDDVLEFLHCIHPRIDKMITGSNVYQVLPLIHEYQIEGFISSCRRALTDVAKSVTAKQMVQTQHTGFSVYKTSKEAKEAVLKVLKVFVYALRYEFEDVAKTCVSLLQFSHYDDYIENDMFTTLPGEAKYMLASAALKTLTNKVNWREAMQNIF